LVRFIFYAGILEALTLAPVLLGYAKGIWKARKRDVLGTVKKAYPAIAKLKVKLSRGDAVYMILTTSPEVSGYITLIPDHKGRDQFAIEIGWSTKGRFPELPMRPSGRASSTRFEFQKDEFMCRLSSLCTTKDCWWGENEPGGSRNRFADIFAEMKYRQENGGKWQNRAVKYATDAVERVVRYGIPYLDEFFAFKQVSRA
jgi:hypothetical protein